MEYLNFYLSLSQQNLVDTLSAKGYFFSFLVKDENLFGFCKVFFVTFSFIALMHSNNSELPKPASQKNCREFIISNRSHAEEQSSFQNQFFFLVCTVWGFLFAVASVACYGRSVASCFSKYFWWCSSARKKSLAGSIDTQVAPRFLQA